MKSLIAALKRVVASPTPEISPQEAIDKGLFGPVYHGTSDSNRENIDKHGFEIRISDRGTSGVSNGYPITDYYGSKPPPVHHLGFGIYFTTVKAIGKKFNNNSLKGLKSYYLDIPKLEEINFGAPRTMMKWWEENGYDMPKVDNFGSDQVREQRLQSTINLTDELKSKYDAVWFKGKGLSTLLDGDQVVVFDVGNIYQVNPKLASGLEVGAKVRRKEDGMTGVIKGQRIMADRFKEYHPKGVEKWFEVKWKKGGTTEVYDIDIEPLT